MSHQLQSIDQPEMADFREIRSNRILREHRICIATGARAVRTLLASHFRIRSLVLTQEWYQTWRELLHEQLIPEERIWIASKSMMEAITRFRMTQGVMACVERMAPPNLQETMGKKPILLVALDQVNHAVNIGNIIRNCAAFGTDGVLYSGDQNDPFSSRAIAASAGAIFHLPAWETKDLENLLAEILKIHTVELVAATPGSGEPLDRFIFPARACIVVGNEHQGISKSILGLQPRLISIPMSATVDSLNVAAATAVLLYCARSQKTSQTVSP